MTVSLALAAPVPDLLAATGGTIPTWVVVLAIVLVVAGIAALVVTSVLRRRRGQ